jgi:hypothetical protein
MAGALSFYTVMMQKLEHHTLRETEPDVQLMTDMVDELHNFGKQVGAGRK